MARPINEKRPPRGVASLMGLALSSTLWFMLNRSTTFSARRGRALKPVAFSAVREKATKMANVKSREKITNQARRDWVEVVGRGVPKKAVEVAAEARVVVVTELVSEARAGQDEKGEVGAPLPCASSLEAPLGNASALKLYRGREVEPGQKAVPSQSVQAGTVPAVPLAQPRQERLSTRARMSEEKLGKAEGRRGSGQVRGSQSLEEAAAARRGCLPAGQAYGRARHCESCVEPVEAVVFPLGQAVHCVTDTAPGMPL